MRKMVYPILEFKNEKQTFLKVKKGNGDFFQLYYRQVVGGCELGYTCGVERKRRREAKEIKVTVGHVRSRYGKDVGHVRSR